VVNGFVDAGLCVVYGVVAEMEVSEGVPALDRKSALHVTVYDVVRRSDILIYCGRRSLSGWRLHNSLLAVVGV